MNNNLAKARAQRRANCQQRHQQPANIVNGKLVKQLREQLVEKDVEIMQLQVEMVERNQMSSLCDKLNEQLQVELGNVAPMYAYILAIICISRL